MALLRDPKVTSPQKFRDKTRLVESQSGAWGNILMGLPNIFGATENARPRHRDTIKIVGADIARLDNVRPR